MAPRHFVKFHKEHVPESGEPSRVPLFGTTATIPPPFPWRADIDLATMKHKRTAGRRGA